MGREWETLEVSSLVFLDVHMPLLFLNLYKSNHTMCKVLSFILFSISSLKLIYAMICVHPSHLFSLTAVYLWRCDEFCVFTFHLIDTHVFTFFIFAFLFHFLTSHENVFKFIQSIIQFNHFKCAIQWFQDI